MCSCSLVLSPPSGWVSSYLLCMSTILNLDLDTLLKMSSLALAMLLNTSRPYSLPTRTKCVNLHAPRLHVAHSTCGLHQVDLALAVAVGSCIQISLFVILVLVLIGWAIGKPMSLLCAFCLLPSQCFC